MTIKWNPSFNGGLSQYFIIQYREQVKNWRNTTQIQDNGLKEMNYTIFQLTEGTTYEFQMFAGNSLGVSTKSSSFTATTLAKGKTYNTLWLWILFVFYNFIAFNGLYHLVLIVHLAFIVRNLLK